MIELWHNPSPEDARLEEDVGDRSFPGDNYAGPAGGFVDCLSTS
jgi:hypothetical protein